MSGLSPRRTKNSVDVLADTVGVATRIKKFFSRGARSPKQQAAVQNEDSLSADGVDGGGYGTYGYGAYGGYNGKPGSSNLHRTRRLSYSDSDHSQRSNYSNYALPSAAYNGVYDAGRPSDGNILGAPGRAYDANDEDDDEDDEDDEEDEEEDDDISTPNKSNVKRLKLPREEESERKRDVRSAVLGGPAEAGDESSIESDDDSYGSGYGARAKALNALEDNAQKYASSPYSQKRSTKKKKKRTKEPKETQKSKDYALLCAAKTGNISHLKISLGKDANVNAVDNAGRSPLFYASSNNFVDIVKTLLTNGGSADHQDKDGNSALHIAAKEGRTEVVDILLSTQAAKTTIFNSRNESPLELAAFARHEQTISKFCMYSNPDVRQNETDKTILMKAAEQGNEFVVDQMIAGSAEVNLIEGEGKTPLLFAAGNGHLPVVKKLISHNADVNRIDRAGHCALTQSCVRGDQDTVKFLLDSKADINHKDEAGCPCLLHAVRKNAVDVMTSILNIGADVNVVDEEHERTSLMEASIMGHVEIVSELLKRSADVNLVDQGQNTALQHAAREGHFEAIKLLWQESDLAHSNKNGMTVFDLAVRCEKKPLRIINLLAKRYITYEAKFIPYDRLLNVGLLDSGAYGLVYKADMNIGLTVDGPATIAVVCKVPRLHAGSNEWHELQTLQNIPIHPNVLGLLAMCTGFQVDGAMRTSIILLYKEGGSLLNYLSNKKHPMSLKRMLTLGLDMAKAVLHLHNHNYKHCDIAARNFLMSEKEEEKTTDQQSLALTDFGLTRPVEFDDDDIPPLPVQWCAPEVLCSGGRRMSCASDIWMLGVTFWEMMFHPYTRPFAYATSVIELTKAMSSGQHLVFPSECSTQWKNLILYCCHPLQQKRLTAQEVVDVLGEMHQRVLQEEEMCGDESTTLTESSSTPSEITTPDDPTDTPAGTAGAEAGAVDSSLGCYVYLDPTQAQQTETFDYDDIGRESVTVNRNVIAHRVSSTTTNMTPTDGENVRHAQALTQNQGGARRADLTLLNTSQDSTSQKFHFFEGEGSVPISEQTKNSAKYHSETFTTPLEVDIESIEQRDGNQRYKISAASVYYHTLQKETGAERLKKENVKLLRELNFVREENLRLKEENTTLKQQTS